MLWLRSAPGGAWSAAAPISSLWAAASAFLGARPGDDLLVVSMKKRGLGVQGLGKP